MMATDGPKLKAARPADPEALAGEVMTMVLEGELSVADLAEVCSELFRLAHRGYRRVVIDLHEVSHLDYRGLKPLAARADLYRRGGGDIKLCRVSAYLFAILQAVGLHQSFDLYATVEDALRAFEATDLRVA
jgi:anti-anti-sigma factor